MLNGQNIPDSGRINLLGEDTTGKKPRAIWRLGVGRTFQITATFPTMTVRENVQVALVSYGRQLFNLWASTASCARRRGRPAARSGRHGGLCRAPLRRTRLWRSQAAGIRGGAGQPAKTAADGRADRRHGAARTHRVDAADRAHCARNSRSACSSPSTTWTWCSSTPTASWCSIAARLIAEGSPDEVRGNPQVRAIYLGEGLVYDARHREGARAHEAQRSGPQQLLRPRAYPVRYRA